MAPNPKDTRTTADMSVFLMNESEKTTLSKLRVMSEKYALLKLVSNKTLVDFQRYLSLSENGVFRISGMDWTGLEWWNDL